MVTPEVKRGAVAHVCKQHGVSQRRACEVLSIDRSSVRYCSVRPDDADIREAMKAVASERRRFGYRRIHVMLDRQGIVMNLKKLRRLYREEKLTVRKRGGRKRALGTRRPWHYRRDPTSAGAWTSSAMPSRMVAAFAFLPLLTTLPANAWRWSPTRRFQVGGLRGNSMPSSPGEASRERLSLTMERR